jgi:hypothetical protein
VTLSAANSYRGDEQAPELRALAKALGLRKPSLRVGAAVREGVCCIDLELSDGTTNERRLRIHLARGATVIVSKAAERSTNGRAFCDEELDVEVQLGD